MPDAGKDKKDIRDTDIIFRCDNCGKSLAIDPRGAGLAVTCTDCGTTVSVPDKPPKADAAEETEHLRRRVQELEKSVRRTRAMAGEYAASLQELQIRRTHLEKAHAEDLGRLDVVARAIDTIKTALADIERCLRP